MPLDINMFRVGQGGNPDIIRESQRRRHKPVELVDEIIALDDKWRYMTGSIDEMKGKRNKVQKEVAAKKKAGEPCDDLVAQIKQIGDEIIQIEKEQADLKVQVDSKVTKIGNIVEDCVPVSDNEDFNRVERTWGTPRDPAGLLNHHDLLWRIGGYEPDRGSAVAGHRGYFLKDVGVLLNQAFINYGIAFLRKRNYCPLQPPYMMKKDVMAGVAQLEQFDEELYKVGGESDDKYLIATSEQPICGYHMGEWIDEKTMPIRYAGISTCFRKEAGSHGKDTWGIFRVHQFEKVEQFVLCEGDLEVSKKMQDEMIASAEEFYQSLGFPYQVINIVSGALNNAAIKKFDLECWFPGYNAYRELVSCSNCTDYQSRSMEIRSGLTTKATDKNKKYVHMLNATLCATGRAICCLLETYQEANGVRVPPVLVPFMGGIDFLPFVRESRPLAAGSSVSKAAASGGGGAAAPPQPPKAGGEEKKENAPVAAESVKKAITTSGNSKEDGIRESISAKAEEIKVAKAAKAAKEVVEPMVKDLLALKATFKEVTGQDFDPPKEGGKKEEKKPAAAAVTVAAKPAPAQAEERKPASRPEYTSPAPAFRMSTLSVAVSDWQFDGANVDKLEVKLRFNTYVNGAVPSADDKRVFASLSTSLATFGPAVSRWMRQMRSFTTQEMDAWK